MYIVATYLDSSARLHVSSTRNGFPNDHAYARLDHSMQPSRKQADGPAVREFRHKQRQQ